MRAHVIILSFEGRQIKDITKICRISRFAVSRVINRWEENGFRGLFDNPRSGRTRSLTAEDEELIHKMVEEDPRSVKKIISVLEDQRGKKVSRSTVKRAIKKKRVWKRIRKSLKSKRDEEHFRRTKDRINSLEQRRLKGEIDIFYFDEAGFDLTPCVPYAWQPKNEYIEVPPAKSQRLNTLAFMDKENACTPYVFECNINADVVISCFDNFSETITKKTFVILDNAPVHKSKKFLSRLPEWSKKRLYLKFLPKYSPELNLIEILWRKIKYEWLPFEAYTSFRELAEWLDYILLNFGSQYLIEFS
jgi:transposase